jgi:PKD repeat protein
MASPARRRELRPPAVGPIGTLVLLGAVALLLVPLPGAAEAPGSPATATSSSSVPLVPDPATTPLDLAAASLSAGAGPAAGAAWSCSAGASAAATCERASRGTGAIPRTFSRNWTNETSSLPTAPAAAYWTSMVYDAADRYVLLFGGTPSGGQTWTFQNGRWTQITAGTAPGARFASQMVYDIRDHYVLLFSGCLTGKSCIPWGLVDDTWTYQAGTWMNVTSTLSVSPPARRGAGIAYDISDQAVVLFGGEGATQDLGDTWEWANGTWSSVIAATAPQQRQGPAMDYDPNLGVVVLFGGEFGSGVDQDTWTFHRGVWTDITGTVPTAPSPRAYADLVVDPGDGVLLLFGGVGGTVISHYFNETWTFNGAAWVNLTSQLKPAPPARDLFSMVYDPGNGTLLLFGGHCVATPSCPTDFGDTWTYGGGPLHALATVSPTIVDRGQQPAVFLAGVNGGTPPYTFGWTFGDGGSGGGASASHIYNSTPGPETATLTVHDALGATIVATVVVEVAASFIAGSIVASPSTVDPGHSSTLSVAASGGAPPYAYTWNLLPPPCTSSNVSSFACAPTAPGFDGLSVIVEDSNGFSLTRLGGLTVAPVLADSILLTPGVVEPGQMVDLAATPAGGESPYSEAWAFDDGSAHATGPSAQHAYTMPGNYTVELWTNDSGGATNLTSAVVRVLPPLAGTPAASPGELDVGETVHLSLPFDNASAAASYTWKGLPRGCAGANASALACVPSTSGNATIVAIINDTDGASWTTRSLHLEVNPFPTVALVLSADEGPAPLRLSYTATASGGTGTIGWFVAFGDGSTSGAPSGTHAFLQAGVYTVRAWANDTTGASATTTSSVTVLQPLVVSLSFSSNNSAPGTSVTVSVATSGGGAVISYTWKLDGAALSDSEGFYSFTPTSPGHYVFSVEISDSYGEEANATAVLFIGTSGSSGGGGLPLGTGLALVAIVAVAVVALLFYVRLARKRGSTPSGAGTATAARSEAESPGAAVSVTPKPSAGKVVVDGALPAWPMVPITVVETPDPSVLWKIAASSGVDRPKMLILTTNLPAEISGAHGLVGAEVRQLSRTEGEDKVAPGDVDRIADLIETHMGKGTGRAVVIEGVERIVDAASLKNTRRLLQVAGDVAKSTRGSILFSLNPELLSLQERRQLEEGASTVLTT